MSSRVQGGARLKVDWPALPEDVIRKIGDLIMLMDNDNDYYADFRRACGGWRRATEPKFMPTKWINVEHSDHDYMPIEANFTFMNLSTGRCVRKNFGRLIRRYFFVGTTTDGLMVLGQRVQPYKTRLFNPFSHEIKRLRAQIPAEKLSAIGVTMSPLMVFASDFHHHYVMWADVSTEENTKESPTYLYFGEARYESEDWFGGIGSMTAYAGDVYVTNRLGSIICTSTSVDEEGTQLPRSAKTLRMNITIAGSGNPQDVIFSRRSFYLVEFEGELLHVVGGRVYDGQVVVYGVDTENRVLKPLRSIGSRALFVSRNRCISIDTRKFHHIVQAGSIYYADSEEMRAYGVSGSEEEPRSAALLRDLGLGEEERPFSLVDVLTNYCRTPLHSDLQMVLPFQEEWITHYEYYDGSASDR